MLSLLSYIATHNSIKVIKTYECAGDFVTICYPYTTHFYAMVARITGTFANCLLLFTALDGQVS